MNFFELVGKTEVPFGEVDAAISATELNGQEDAVIATINDLRQQNGDSIEIQRIQVALATISEECVQQVVQSIVITTEPRILRSINNLLRTNKTAFERICNETTGHGYKGDDPATRFKSRIRTTAQLIGAPATLQQKTEIEAINSLYQLIKNGTLPIADIKSIAFEGIPNTNEFLSSIPDHALLNTDHKDSQMNRFLQSLPDTKRVIISSVIDWFEQKTKFTYAEAKFVSDICNALAQFYLTYIKQNRPYFYNLILAQSKIKELQCSGEETTNLSDDNLVGKFIYYYFESECTRNLL